MTIINQLHIQLISDAMTCYIERLKVETKIAQEDYEDRQVIDNLQSKLFGAQDLKTSISQVQHIEGVIPMKFHLGQKVYYMRKSYGVYRVTGYNPKDRSYTVISTKDESQATYNASYLFEY